MEKNIPDQGDVAERKMEPVKNRRLAGGTSGGKGEQVRMEKKRNLRPGHS